MIKKSAYLRNLEVIKEIILLTKRKLAHMFNVNSILWNTKWLLILVLTTLLIQCKKNDIPVLPIVASINPADKAVDVVLDKVLSVTFNTVMDPLTINKTTFSVKQGNTLISGVVSPTTNGKTFTFKPDVALLPFTTYTGTITTGAKDSKHTAIAKDHVWIFTTLLPVGSLGVNLLSSPLVGGTTDGAGAYRAGATVTVTAIPNTGYKFSNWSGDVTGTVNPLTFVITANRNITANFVLDPSGTPIGPTAIDLKTAGDFQILTKSGISTTGVTSVNGNIGVSPSAASAITGFGLIMDTGGASAHTPIVSGKVYASDYAAPTPAKMTTAVSDMETAFTTASDLVTPAPIVNLYAGDISGRTLPAGLYKWSTGVLITNAGVTLSGGPNDTWVFQISQDLTINNSAKITLLGGAQAKNIFWIVSGKATLGTNTECSGVILSKTMISLNTGAKITGKLLSQTAVTLNASTVIQP